MSRFPILVLIILLNACAMTSSRETKINGVSFVASKDSISEKNIIPLVKLNANYASVMPFGFIRELSHPEIIYNSDRQWFGETEAGVKQYTETLKNRHIKVMLKPQIWVWNGEFTGLIKMNSDEDWKVLEQSYSNFILNFARIAQEMSVEIFCIGTELESFIDERPDYWYRLIKDIRKVYKGKLTYAANWNEFERTPFWSELDYIGVDGYFPLSEEQTPSLEQCKQSWQKHKVLLKSYSKKFDKPILFTEFGYRSIDFAGKYPWKVDRENGKVNLGAQAVLTRSLFEELWDEDWFAGGFVWKWYHDHELVGGIENNRFTPQNKPAEEVIREFYAKH